MNDKTLLEQFHKEVFVIGAEACLPVNLDQRWLSILCDQSRVVGSSEDVLANEFMSAILCILQVKRGSIDGTLDIDEDELADCAGQYRMELLFEQAARQQGMTVVPATVETIFTEREAIIVRRGRST